MYCKKCGKKIDDDAFFCQWCGSEVLLSDTDAIVKRLNVLIALDKSFHFTMAKYIAAIWRSEAYKESCDSLEAFGKARLGMERSSLYKYKSVGLNFFSESGEPLIPDVEKWGYAKLTILVPLGLEEIEDLKEMNLISPEMTSKELRAVITGWQKLKSEKMRTEAE